MSALALVPGRGPGPALAAAMALVVVVGALAGCATDNHPVIMVDNRTHTEITVVFIDQAARESSMVGAIAPGTRYPIENFPASGCKVGVLVARDTASGAEVARSASPVCRPSTFVVEAPSAPPAT